LNFVLNYLRNIDVILKILLPAGSSWYFWTWFCQTGINSAHHDIIWSAVSKWTV